MRPIIDPPNIPVTSQKLTGKNNKKIPTMNRINGVITIKVNIILNMVFPLGFG
ncbi:MAG: hypothetical protein HRU28_17830 [Rhizobiales bacterium]|nr:hypothetical protein [Hyphomicrobiales bacterium]